MLKKTSYQIPKELLDPALNLVPSDDFRFTLNKPTGNFFYDPWEMKAEFMGTVWDKFLLSIKEPIGEARIIVLDPGKCYQAHADIDDRFHLNVLSDEAYLIDLENSKMHLLHTDGFWYSMDAGRRHTAMNVGRTSRIQLVVRQLLKNSKLTDPEAVKITFDDISPDHARFVFDQTLSPVLNRFNKIGIMNSFEYSSTFVKFNLERDFVSVLKTVLPSNFRLEK